MRLLGSSCSLGAQEDGGMTIARSKRRWLALHQKRASMNEKQILEQFRTSSNESLYYLAIPGLYLILAQSVDQVRDAVKELRLMLRSEPDSEGWILTPAATDSVIDPKYSPRNLNPERIVIERVKNLRGGGDLALHRYALQLASE